MRDARNITPIRKQKTRDLNVRTRVGGATFQREITALQWSGARSFDLHSLGQRTVQGAVCALVQRYPYTCIPHTLTLNLTAFIVAIHAYFFIN